MPISRSLFVESKKLRIFDFDDTLVKTNSFIYVTHKDGKASKLRYAISSSSKTVATDPYE